MSAGHTAQTAQTMQTMRVNAIASEATDDEPGARSLPILKFAVAGVAIAGLGFLLLTQGEAIAHAIQTFNTWVSELGPAAPIVFALGYAVSIIAFVPGSLLTAAAGAIFGVGQGTLYTFLGASLGASGAFLIARYLARDAIESRLADNARFHAVDSAIGREGRKIVFLLRLSPVFPFTFLNYLLGLTRVSLKDYVIGHLGMLPGTLLYVYIGKVAAEVASLGAEGGGRGGAESAFLIFGLVVTAVVTVIITRIAKRALQEATQETAQEMTQETTQEARHEL